MSEKLERCPFCGGEAFTHILGNEIAKGYYIACDECGAKTIVFDYEAEAITAWNTAMGIAEKSSTVERTAKAEYSDSDGEYLCKACGRVVQIEDAYCCGCGCRLEWG